MRTASAFERKHLGDDLRIGRVRALAHVGRAGVERGRAVGRDIDDRDRRGRRDRGLEADGDAAAAADRGGAAIELLIPPHARGERVEHFGDCGVLHGGAARLRAPFAQDVLAAELDRIEVERARKQIGVALIGPDQLRYAEAAQRAGGRAVGVKLIRIDADVFDVVGPGRGEAGFLRHPRADIRIGAAVPKDLAGARHHAPILADAALDTERRRMLGDHVKLFFHGQRDLYRPADDERQYRDQSFELDIDLGAETAAEIRHLHPHAVLRPAEQPRDLGAHE